MRFLLQFWATPGIVTLEKPAEWGHSPLPPGRLWPVGQMLNGRAQGRLETIVPSVTMRGEGRRYCRMRNIFGA